MENKLSVQTEKPIAFLKVKTTGLDFLKDRIVEISIVRIEKDGSKKAGTRLVNPEMDIPEDATKVNGITNEMVAGKPTFKEIGANILKFVDGCDFAGFNASFDLRFLIEECNRSGLDFTMINKKVVDLLEIYCSMEPRDFRSASSFYNQENIDKNKVLSSEEINSMSISMLNNMISKYSGIECENKNGQTFKVDGNIETLNKLFNKNANSLDSAGFIVIGPNGRSVFSRGKFEGSIVADTLMTDKSYYEFLIGKSDLPADTKSVINKIYAKAQENSKTTQKA